RRGGARRRHPRRHRAARVDRRARRGRVGAALSHTLAASGGRRWLRRRARARRARVERVAPHSHRVAPTNPRLPAGDLAMARSPAEIEADIAVTRRVIERQLYALGYVVLRCWWVPYTVCVCAVAVGF